MNGIEASNEGTTPAFLQRLVDDVRVLVLGPRQLTDSEFDAHLVEAIAMARNVRVVLVVIIGEGLMSPQSRAKLAGAGLLETPTGVMTDSIRVRGLLTPINWLGGKVKPFAPNEFEKASDYLAIPSAARSRLLEHVLAMKAAFGEVDGEKTDGSRPLGATIATVKRALSTWVAMKRKKSGTER
jgi:hypothetical protein